MTGLEALEKIKRSLEDEDKYINLFDKCNLIFIEKRLKALEIIKSSITATPNIEKIKTIKGDFIEVSLALTQEEFLLLKEVLK